LIEVVEPNTELMKLLDNRVAELVSYKGYGPPDLCYFIKQEKQIFSKPINIGYYHYIYGADTSSAASIATYMCNILKRSQTE